MATTGIPQIHDTTIFNNTLEALDTGKIVYLLIDDGYNIITSFIIVNSNGSLLIECYTNDHHFVIYPSEGYNTSDLYTPINLTILEDSIEPIAE